MPTEPLESSQPLQTSGRYGSGAMAFHWIMFLLVVVVGILGLLHDDWSKQTQAFWINVHAVIGILLWFTLIARFAWRSRHAPPTPPSNVGAFARRFAGPVHWALYALMFITPILGFVTFIYHGRIFDFGLFQINFGVAKNHAIFHPTEDIHGYLAYALFGLAGLHALVALWHQFYLHDGMLGRMWPFRLTASAANRTISRAN
ncbi:MAG: cytochrome b [Steroidobacteraceae bacterium]|jgi:cytochrome b561